MSEKITSLNRKVCEEAPVDLIVNGRKMITFMCTPKHLNELALGHLFSRGLINGVDDVMTLAACDDMRKIYVNTANELSNEHYSLGKLS